MRHVDVPAARGGFNPLGRSEEDGGSFSGAATRREVSMLLYLNPGWDPAWGGALRIFVPDEESEEGEEGEEGRETHVDVTPEAGTLACSWWHKWSPDPLVEPQPRSPCRGLSSARAAL